MDGPRRLRCGCVWCVYTPGERVPRQASVPRSTAPCPAPHAPLTALPSTWLPASSSAATVAVWPPSEASCRAVLPCVRARRWGEGQERAGVRESKMLLLLMMI
jgi:hypothetical protein